MQKPAASQRACVKDWRAAILSKDGPDSTTRLLLHTLSFHMRRSGDNCYPSIGTLERETGLSRPTVIDHIKKAEREGWLTVERKKNSGEIWQSNHYFATVPFEVGN